MKITFYGTRGIYPPGAQTSCTLVEGPEGSFVIDLGSTDLFQEPETIEKINHALLTHLHPDHIEQLPRLLEAKPECVLLAPEPIPKKCTQLLTAPPEWCGLRLETFVTNHPKRNYAYKLSGETTSVVWTGDAAYEPAFAKFCTGVDAIICESSMTEEHREEAIHLGHMCPSLFAQLMNEARPKLAIATHFVELEPSDFLPAVQQTLHPEISLIAAHEGLVLDLS